MSGCFDGAIGEAEAEANEDSGEYTENEYQDVIRTVYIEPGDVVNITLDGNTTLELVSGLRVVTSDAGSDPWRVYLDLSYFMHCEGYNFPSNYFRLYAESLYTGNLPDTICYLELDTTSPNSDFEYYYIFSFKEHPLDSL